MMMSVFLCILIYKPGFSRETEPIGCVCVCVCVCVCMYIGIYIDIVLFKKLVMRLWRLLSTKSTGDPRSSSLKA